MFVKRLPRKVAFPVLTLLLIAGCLQMPTALWAQSDITVKGRVTSKDDDMAIPGVNILLKGSAVGTTTDFDGQYTIKIPDANGTLVFSFIGYTTQEVAVAGQSVIDVALESDTETLSEVVVVGYGEQKKETLTGSISQIKGADMVESPQPNVSNSLAGRFSGVIVNNRSGEPGYDGSDINIRGLATTGNNDVLVVIDGIPGQLGGLQRLNPNDIESISVLKDASAAVYGNRAANGVILVTTKRGKAGKPKIAYSFNQGFSSPTRVPDMANAATYATIVNEIAYYNNPDGGMNQSYSDEEIQKFRDGSDPLNYPNTDWAAKTLKKVTLQNQHNLSLSGGNNDVNYFVSLGTLSQDGLYKNGATNYNQYSIRSNINANVTENFNISLLLNGRQEERQYPISSASNIFRSIYRAYPTVAAKYPNGLLSYGIEGSNPVAMVTSLGGTNKNPTDVFNGILKAQYYVPGVDGLSVDGFFSLDRTWDFTKTFEKPYTLYTYNSTDDTYEGTVVGGSDGNAILTEGQENISLITENLKFNYERQLGNHFINSFVAYEQSKRHTETFDATRYNYPSTDTPELSQGGSESTDSYNSGSSSNYRRRSFIGRVAYNYMEKYLAEVQMRVDGSSIFPAGHRYGYFPAISAGYRISEEDWFSSAVPFFNDLKIRGSYGVLGNDNVDAFQYYDNYSFNSTYVIGSDKTAGIDLTKIGNPNITWEKAKKTDVGLNARFLQNFTAEMIYFYQYRSQILAARNASIPGTSGIVNPYGGTLVPDENIGKVKSRGIEATLGYSKHVKEFYYAVSGNITYARNELVFIDEASDLLSYQRQTGGPMNTYLLYKAVGIFRTQEDLDNNPNPSSSTQLGDLIYADIDGDGEITEDDRIRPELTNMPQITFGLNANLAWKNFDLSLLFSGQARVRQYVLPESGTVGNFYSSWADNRWSPTNVNGTYPRVDTRASTSVNGGQFANTFWLNNAAFVRLKNVALGYTLPADVITKWHLTSLRVYANAFNLFTISEVKDYDPEGSSESGQFYPQQRIINLGVNIEF